MGKWDNVYKAFHTVSGIMQVPNKFVRVIYFGDFSVLLGYFILNKNFIVFFIDCGAVRQSARKRKVLKFHSKCQNTFQRQNNLPTD